MVNFHEKLELLEFRVCLCRAENQVDQVAAGARVDRLLEIDELTVAGQSVCAVLDENVGKPSIAVSHAVELVGFHRHASDQLFQDVVPPVFLRKKTIDGHCRSPT